LSKNYVEDNELQALYEKHLKETDIWYDKRRKMGDSRTVETFKIKLREAISKDFEMHKKNNADKKVFLGKN